MKTINIPDQQHSIIKEYARKNGLKIEFVCEIMCSQFIENVINEKPKQAIIETIQEPISEPVKQTEIVEVKPIKTVEVVTQKRVESPTKGMTLFVNSPYFDIELLTEKINEQPRFKRFMPIDVQKLYDTIYSWSESNFEKRKDWLSVAFTFLSKAKGGEFKPNGIVMNKRDQEIINWMNS